MAIIHSYNPANNTYTITGGNVFLPASFTALAAYDAAHGIGKVVNLGDGLFTVNCHIIIGNGSTSTYFVDLDKTIVVKDNAVAFMDTVFYVMANATFRLGENYTGDTVNKPTWKGCDLIFDFTTIGSWLVKSEGVTYLLDCRIRVPNGNLSAQFLEEVESVANSRLYLWNCSFSGSVVFYTIKKGGIFNGYLTSTTDSYPVYNTTLIDKLALTIAFAALVSDTTVPITIRNLYCRNISYLFWGSGITADVNLVNCDTDVWRFVWGGDTGKVNRQYTLDLHVTDINQSDLDGVTVDLQDKNGNSVTGFPVTTGFYTGPTGVQQHGRIPSTTVTRGYYDAAHGDSLQESGPHTLTTSKAGYQTYTEKLTFDRKLDLEVGLAAAGGGVSPTNPGLLPLGIKQMAF